MIETDPKPIMYEGAPTSTGGMEDAVTMCNLLGIPFKVEKPDEVYMHGWGTDCAGARQVKCSWEITIMDESNRPVSLIFDLVEGRPPLITGMDLKRYADTCNRTVPGTITFKRPQDKHVFKLCTYILKDNMGNLRLRLSIVPYRMPYMQSLMGSNEKRPELIMAKRVHRFGHASVNDMI